ncbi:MAG: hypothetical protein V3T31_10100, partial [candidate division Zixibacteria bacterium]
MQNFTLKNYWTIGLAALLLSALPYCLFAQEPEPADDIQRNYQINLDEANRIVSEYSKTVDSMTVSDLLASMAEMFELVTERYFSLLEVTRQVWHPKEPDFEGTIRYIFRETQRNGFRLVPQAYNQCLGDGMKRLEQADVSQSKIHASILVYHVLLKDMIALDAQPSDIGKPFQVKISDLQARRDKI